MLAKFTFEQSTHKVDPCTRGVGRLFQNILESEPLSGNTWRAASKQSHALEQMLGLILSHPVRSTIVLYHFVVNMTVLSVE